MTVKNLGLLGGLKRSASFTVSVESEEPRRPLLPLVGIAETVGEEEEWSGEEEEEEEVEQVIIPGTDWESVNYVYKKFSCEEEVRSSKYLL